jgi:GNAT superfamily N-acetyltransferase
VALVRPITYRDVAAAVELLRDGSLTPEFEDPSRVDDYWSAVEETRRLRGDVIVAEVDGDVIGVCQVIVFQHFQHAGGWCGEIEGVHVRSDMRSRGIGAELLAAAEALARGRGCYRIQLTSRNVREDAHRFYVANGYGQTSQGFKKFFS